MSMRGLILAFGVFSVLSAPAFAEKAEATADEVTPPAKLLSANPHAEKLETLAKELFSELDAREKDALVVVRGNFGVIRSIQIVHKDIKKTALLCSQEHPAMNDAPMKAFTQWNNAVLPVIDDQIDELKKAVSKDNFKNPKKVQAFLDQLDKAAKYADDNLDKNPVTTQKACENLVDSMGETHKDIVNTLHDMQWPAKPASAPENEGQADDKKKS